MKKKVLAVVLMLVMVLSMTACSSLGKRPTVEDVFNSFNDAQVNSMTEELVIEISGITVALKLNGTTDENNNVYMTVLAKVNAYAYKMDDYQELTNIYVVNDEIMYIDMEQVADFISKLDKQLEQVVSEIELPAEYLVCTPEECLLMMFELSGKSGTYIEGINFEALSLEEEALQAESGQIFKDFLKEFVKVSNGTATEVDKDSFKISIDNDNIDSVLNCVRYIDLEPYYRRLLSLCEKVGAMPSEQLTLAEKDASKLNEAMSQAIDRLDTSSEKIGMLDFDYEMSVKNNIQYMNTVMESDFINFKFMYEARQETVQTISLPANTMTPDEFVQMFYDYGMM